MTNKKIGVVTIATGKYEMFIPMLFYTFKRKFITTMESDLIVLTDSKEIEEQPRLIIRPVEHTGWPYSTLMRFHYFDRYKELLSNYDYVFFIDCDMSINNIVDENILPTEEEKYVGTLHPGFYAHPHLGTFEVDTASTAYVPGENRKIYYQACFFGAIGKEFIEMSETLKNNVDKDLKKDLIAIWHDESHLNSYYSDKKVKLLHPGYAYPENWNIPFDKKIIHLAKNHTEIRK